MGPDLPPGWERVVREALAAVRPDLASGPLRPLGAGFTSIALLLDGPDAYVLRFPKNQDGADGAEREARLLPELAARLDVPIPRFAFTAPNPFGPGDFHAYPLVPGDSLSEDEWRERGLLDEPDPPRQIAEMLDAVHSFPMDRAKELGVEEWDLRATFTEQLAPLHAEVLPLLSPSAAKALLTAWEGYVGDDANFDYEPTLIHADISLDHLLVTGTRITGLIDFGDVTISDPDYEFCYLWPEAGRDFVTRVQRHRGLALTPRLEAKLRFWTLADPATDLLHAREHDLPDLHAETLVYLRDLLDD
ncbi:phosphotransferase family protein [Spirillospora sp. CA-294931]|uniref:phosphotransferase family protein n=1 Tax=Spirillospora sp. CA-294931 TaxID=3240042 RepID=UPI003D90861C